MDQPTLLFIGGGKMGGALIRGLLAQNFRQITLVDPQMPAELGDIRVLPDMGSYDGPRPDAVILAIKPQLMDAVLPPMATRLRGSLVISIAAGKTLDFLKGIFGQDAPLVRAMPNLPAALGAGMTGWIGTSNLSDPQRALSQRILTAAGQAHELADEAQIDAWTALAGSGPAYLFHLLECLSAAAQDLGFDAALSQDLALRTVVGAARLADQSGESFATLRENVTSPGGTTAAGLDILMPRLPDLILATVKAAEQRAQELANA